MKRPGHSNSATCIRASSNTLLFLIIYLFILAIVSPLTVSAGEFTFLTEHPGRVSAPVTVANALPSRLSRADAAVYKRNLERLRDLLISQPVFNPPRGVEVIGYLRPLDELPVNTRVPVPGFGYLRFHFYHESSKTGLPVRICCTTDEIYLTVNNPDAGLDACGVPGLSGKAFYEPKQVVEQDGFPVYRMDNGDEVIVLVRSSAPPWIPLTREEYVSAWLKNWRKIAAESPPADTITPEIVRRHEAALAAMSAEERRMQARELAHDPFEPTLAPVGSDEGRPLVRTNP
ncbi:MAG: hypothetical protein EG824_09705, partial [Deltaproteobacteria bacterium]|nr:hypothetical protein [Deltaproteobacteria bacterium]